ncbi:hypothetical protein KC331_g2434 [Hortaea werneckii]|nr:hypothetical protein KC331_g2434 [Hortaea werneckii]KAI7720261.1 hypothetical protein KC353_g2333 [Hortaea werneckii]
MVIVLEYEQAEVKLSPEVEVDLLLIVPVVELGTTDGKGLALCADFELKEGDGTKLLVLRVLPLLVKPIVVETDWKPDNDELLTCELVEDKFEEAAALDANVEAEAVPKSVDDELCVDDALHEVLDCCEDDVDVKAVEFSTPPEFEGPVKEEEYTGGEKLEDDSSPVPTETEGSNVEEEVANNDVGVVGLLVGWIEELEYGAGKEDAVLKLKLSKEEGEVEKDADDSELPLSTRVKLDSSEGIEEEADRREDVAEKAGSMLEEL